MASNVPRMIELLQEIRKCNRFGFEVGHPIRDALRDLIRIEQPILAARIANNKAERDERNRKPTQLRLFLCDLK